MRVLSIALAEILTGLSATLFYHCWPRQIDIPKPRTLERIEFAGDNPVISWHGQFLIGRLAEFDNALDAVLMFDYYRGREPLKNRQVLLILDRAAPKPLYRILVCLPNNLIAGVTELASLQTKHLAASVEFAWVNRSKLQRYQQETVVFTNVYQDPNTQDLQQIAPAELQAYVAQFIRFKSATDPRSWKEVQSALSPADNGKADQLAADIILVSEFYGIPVDVMLGIGAMENNFLDAPGDLNNAVWKKRAERDDIVLQRKRHKVWVLNSSMGIWQITRQSLRRAQQLFLADQRDYALLPERLRPAQKLDMENLEPEVLTTYAGLLLRDLIDQFGGDLEMAAGAYNGTTRQPNLHYAEGVEMVASYARRVIGCTAELNLLASSQLLTETNVSAKANVQPKPLSSNNSEPESSVEHR